MNVERQFSDYVRKLNVTGSNKADSYIRAIGYANTMLKGFGGKFQNIGDIFSIDSVDQLKALHEFLLSEGCERGFEPAAQSERSSELSQEPFLHSGVAFVDRFSFGVGTRSGDSR